MRVVWRASPAGLAEWHTRWSQTPLSEKTCGFESHTRHQPLTGGPVGGRGHGLLMAHVRPQQTVDSALAHSDVGVPDAENARLHGVAVKTVRRWRRDYQRRGRRRGQEHLSARCPRCQGGEIDAQAYAELLGWYLGDGYLSRGRRDVYNLHVGNDLAYPGLNDHLRDLMAAVKPASRPHRRVVSGCVVTTVSWKHWPCMLPQHGGGRKHERRLVLEDWQQDIVAASGRLLARPVPLGRVACQELGDGDGGWSAAPLRLPTLAVRQQVRGHHGLLHRRARPGRGLVATLRTLDGVGVEAGSGGPPRRPRGAQAVNARMTTRDERVTIGPERLGTGALCPTCPDQLKQPCFASATNGPDA
ncbi:MAG: hypothetical protein JWR42_211 [Marmoricola sp.]|nr:hypothetical protein [Marmoricola sp.]